IALGHRARRSGRQCNILKRHRNSSPVCPFPLRPVREAKTMWSRSIAVLAVVAPVWIGAPPAWCQTLTASAVNAAEFSVPLAKGLSAAVLKAQILLDRAGFSPGVIDATDGDNYRKALAAFQQQNGLDPSGT